MTGPLPLSALGATGLAVSPIGLGLAALGRPAYITADRDLDLGHDRGVDAMEHRTHSVLDEAYRAGIRYVDVARSYGRAEAFLASWLRARDIRPGDITVGSKWGYRYTGDWRVDAPVQEVKDHSLAMFRRQRAETEAILGAHLRLYQVHSATLESGVLDDGSVLRALADAAQGGLCMGLSVSGPRQKEVVQRALNVVVDGANPFTCVQATWNLLETSVAPALTEAHAAGWGVLVKEVFANGRLARASPDLPDSIVGLAAAHRSTVGEVALAAALAQPWADVVLTGAVTQAQVRHDVGARLVLTEDELDRLATLNEQPDVYWERRSSLPWW